MDLYLSLPSEVHPPSFLFSFTSWVGIGFGNDPSAGSPTETLLRLLLPLNGQV